MGTSGLVDYCRAVEAHLTRANGGHIVRIVGPAFSLVRGWEASGIPLSVVERAIGQKAERHRQGTAGRSGRPLRIEFCENDVQELFADWKRAVGVMSDAPSNAEAGTSADVATDTAPPAPSRRPSLSKHLERVSERLSRLLGRHDLSEPFLERVNLTISAVSAARERARTARGAARDEIAVDVRPLDAELMMATRVMLGPAELEKVERQAEDELASYRNRLAPEAWEKARTATVDRLLRERFGLPVIDPDEA